MNPPGAAARARIWVAVTVLVAAAAGFKHWQNEPWRSAARLARTGASPAAWQTWATLLRSLRGQPRDAVIERVKAAGSVEWDAGSSPQLVNGVEQRSFLDHASNWNITVKFEAGLLTGDFGGSRALPPATPSPNQLAIEAGRAAVYRHALWVSVLALAAVVLLFAFQLSDGTLAWRRTLAELGLAAAVVGLLAYALAPNAAERFSARALVHDEFLQAHLWMLAGSTLFLRMLRRRPAPADASRCAVCEYNLTGNVSGVCPECGTAAPQRSNSREAS